ncbi:class I SAM-dependent methyltransferase [Lederbergia wuyishanensis]|uniref:Ubiquinone/menaquinone biosynthesis C-methylase UbiE n=1 Tax=Lederbergia wuyishanensis TaxID=1347903 RepID=A0ABU0D862_9BACI|nr:class I SAM-dependent methyltransferase [Lederbergia wuyishanensis]MCJ8009279.1 class I SAM-dependent methyltransferase [Lederbergia wuyishanensis]MDQ0344587.1 ubiquinone/menaquinone biosynthesis C-methylase UbiE [Lederbergia wuyishanensis]
MEKKKLIKIFDKQAKRYEKSKETLKQQRMRNSLISKAEGEVLELAVGAGANFPYYQQGVTVTATDFSEAMLEKAKISARNNNVDAKFICSDLEEISFERHSFDTIVSTLSFCSYENPLFMMEKIQQWCKPGGKILLLEHGISNNRFVAILQKILNPLLFRTIGCHHTRNILEMTQQSGLFVERVESHYFNIVHVIWAKPGDKIHKVI